MRRSLLALWIVAFLGGAVSGCTPKPAAPSPSLSVHRDLQNAALPDEVVSRTEAPGSGTNAAQEHKDESQEKGEVAPADALKVIILQWLVAR